MPGFCSDCLIDIYLFCVVQYQGSVASHPRYRQSTNAQWFLKNQVSKLTKMYYIQLETLIVV